MKALVNIMLLIPFLFVSSCSNKQTADGGSSFSSKVTLEQLRPTLAGESSGGSYELSSSAVSVGGLTFSPVANWKDFGPSGMRKADYAFGPIGNDADSATLTVFYFGVGGGGGVRDNIDRWISQISRPEGVDSSTAVFQAISILDSMTAHFVAVSGAYGAPMGGMMSGQTMSKDNYRLVGVVIETSQGDVFFKLTGPEQTARAMTDGFIALLGSVKRSN